MTAMSYPPKSPGLFPGKTLGTALAITLYMTTCSLRIKANKLTTALLASTGETREVLRAQLKAVLAELEPRNMARKARWERGGR